MSDSCPGCLTSGKGQDEALSIAIKEAKEYAKKEQKSMAVYKEGFEWKFIEAGFAFEQGYQVRQVVSFHT